MKSKTELLSLPWAVPPFSDGWNQSTRSEKADDSNEPSAFRVDGKVLLFLSPPEGDTGADTDSHTGQTDREEYPPHAVRRSRFDRLGSGFRGGFGRGGGGRGGACLSLRNGDRFRLGAAADHADTLLLAFLAFRRLLRDGPVSKGMRAGFREELAAAGIFLRVLRLGDGPFRHAAVYVVRAVDIAVSLAADLALCPPEAGRRAAGMFPRGGDRRAGAQQSIAAFAVRIAGVARRRASRVLLAAHFRAAHMVGGVLFAVGLIAYLAHGRVFARRRAAGVPCGGDHRAGAQQGVAILAVCIAGVAVLRAGGGLGVLHLGAAVVVVRIKLAPLVDVSIRSLVIADGAIRVVHSIRDAGGCGLQVHITLNEIMRILGFSSFFAIAAGEPVSILVVPILRGFCKIISAIVSLAAIGACARRDTGRGAVAAAVCRVNRVAAFTLAGTGVGIVVAVGLPRAPVVAELTVFTAAFLAGFACGAGGRFGAANVILTPEVAFFFAYWA